MGKIELEILGISYSQAQSGAYALILSEMKGNRRLPIIIGGFEAQSIAIELEKMRPSRPLTHDLFKNFAQTFNISITEVIIYKFSEGIFFAKLLCFDGQKVVEIDSRTSDAVAIAVRFKCSIYTYESILTAAGIYLEDEETSSTATTPSEETDNIYAGYTMDELNEELTKAVEDEAYEKASKIRDEIKRRAKK